MDIPEICGKMHLFYRLDFSKNIDTLPQVVKDAYENFISMARAIKDAIIVLIRKSYDTYHHYYDIYVEVRNLIGFIRWALKWCVNDDGRVNSGFVDILTAIESYFMNTSQIFSGEHSDWIWNSSMFYTNVDFQCLVLFIQNADLTFWSDHESFISIFSEESVIERLDQFLEYESSSEMYTKQCVFLKMFIQFVKDHTDYAGREYIYLWAEWALDMISLDVILSNYQGQPFSTTNRIAPSIHTLILRLVWKSDSIPPFNDELLVAYVECFQNFVTWIPKKLNYQIKIIQDMLSLVHSLISDTHKHKIDMKKLLHTKTLVDYALRKLGCITPSFFSCKSDRDKGSLEITEWLTGIFKTLLHPLDSDGFLSDETLTTYACYFRHYLFHLPANRNQHNFDDDLVFVAHLVFYKWSESLVGQELLSSARVEILGVLRKLGSIICSSLNIEVEGHTQIEMHPSLPHLLANFERIKLRFRRTIFHAIFEKFSLHAPDTDLLGFLDFQLENLKELRICNFDLVRNWKDELQTIQEALLVFRSFLQNIRYNNIKDHRLQAISTLIRNAAYNMDYVVNAFAAGAFHVSCRSFIISDLIEQFNLVKEQVNDKEVSVKGLSDAMRLELVPTTDSNKDGVRISSQASTPSTDLNKDGIRMSSRAASPSTDIFEGLEAEKMRLMKFLASNEEKLDVISIAGMGGIGKTTLAKKVYEERFTVNHFHFLAWCCVTQEYNMKDVLLSLLGCDLNCDCDENCQKKSCEDLYVMLHRKLKWCRYLIVLDDVWSIDVFDKLKRYLPNDANGSRIVLTSRTISIGLHAKHHSDTIELHPLSKDESWNLLKRKVFPKEECPIELIEIGNEIARKCGGLPLAVVLIAGILSNSDKEQVKWEEIDKRLNVYTAEDSQGERQMNALDLSFELLPDHLKPLFLYVGAFPEDYEIPAKNLKWIWIAEGFIRPEIGKNKSLEEQAETLLMDLIDRSLLMVGKRNSSGSVKTCHVHDLMREMCLRKAQYENFMQHHHIEKLEHLQEQHIVYPRRVSVSWIDSKDKSTPVSSKVYEAPPCLPITYGDLSRFSMVSRLISLLLFGRVGTSEVKELCKSIFQIHKMLRVFHTDKLGFLVGETFPVHLRYISVKIFCEIPPTLFGPCNIENVMWNLETLIITTTIKCVVNVPGEFWKMVKLRHLHIDYAVFDEPDEDSCKMNNLQTLSRPVFYGEETKIIRRFPNLLHLKCVFSDNDGKIKLSDCPRLESLHQLESVSMHWRVDLECSAQLNLPSTLKKLSLSLWLLKWKDIASFQELPNLEVLKLQLYLVEDKLWDMGDVQFSKLKFLKLEYLDIKQWMASDENFPCLQKLVISDCKHLEEIPSGLGDICSLEKIEVSRCSHRASESAKRIQQEQLEYGNGELKVYISNPLPEEQGA